MEFQTAEPGNLPPVWFIPEIESSSAWWFSSRRLGLEPTGGEESYFPPGSPRLLSGSFSTFSKDMTLFLQSGVDLVSQCRFWWGSD